MSRRAQSRFRTAAHALRRHAVLLGVLAAASAPGASCTGQIGDGGDPSGAGVGSSSPDGSIATGDGGGSTVLEGGAPPIPFFPLSVPSYVTKVKTLLTGMAPTQAEIDAVTADPSALSGLVDAWMKLPAYGAKMELFFGDAFQQSQAQSLDFQGIDDGGFPPNDKLLLNFRQSFARTMTDLIAEGRPFTESATTTRYQMTTAMITYYAYADTNLRTDDTAKDAGKLVNRFFRNDPNWTWSITARNVPLADSGNPASPDYLVFALPSLANQYSDGNVGEDGAAHCAGFDPVVFNNQSSFAYGDNMSTWLYSFMQGGNFWYFNPAQGQPNSYWCQGGSKFLDRPSHTPLLTDADYADWRMVTIQKPSSPTAQTRFFDVVGNRAISTLNIYEPRVGYFMTPAFLSQYPTNISNQARGVINQTMIVGLGQAFDGTNPITNQTPPGLDGEHAGNPACFQCHWSLDPMRRFFRSNLTLHYSTQADPTQIAVPGTFLFGGVTDTGSTLYDLAKQIAIHPQFKTAWTQKLCEWANSAPCLANDPELQRIAGVFASHNYDWNALVHELFTSPLVTYASASLTAQTNGTVTPITRRTQLCETLDNRLGLTDVCGFSAIQSGAGGKSVPAIAVQLPSDGYSRGQVSALYVNDPDPFFRSSIEQICALVADMVVDSAKNPLYSSATPAAVTTSIAGIVHDLMGLDKTRDAEPITILTSHYTSATSGGSTPSVALKSTFTAACISPWVVSVGQ